MAYIPGKKRMRRGKGGDFLGWGSVGVGVVVESLGCEGLDVDGEVPSLGKVGKCGGM